eukprot:g368.t1
MSLFCPCFCLRSGAHAPRGAKGGGASNTNAPNVSPTKLQLQGRGLAQLGDDELGDLNPAELVEVWLQDNKMRELPAAFAAELTSAELIYLTNNQLGAIPATGAQWLKLQELNVSGNPAIAEVPADMAAAWQDLRQIYLNDLPALTRLPASAGSWIRLRVLHANSCGLRALPEELERCVELTQVALNDNQLVRLPQGMGAWKKVEKVFVNNNRLTELPASIGGCEALSKLYVTGNGTLASLPASLGQLQQLQELYVTGNRLTCLPEELGNCAQLGKIYANDNRIDATGLPTTLCSDLRNSLEILNLNNNVLGSGSGSGSSSAPLAAALQDFGQCKRLKFIHLEHNALFGQGRTEAGVASAIAWLQSLQPLVTAGLLRALQVEEGNEVFAKPKVALGLRSLKAGLQGSWSFETTSKEAKG